MLLLNPTEKEFGKLNCHGHPAKVMNERRMDGWMVRV